MTREEGTRKLQKGDTESVKNVLIIETNLDETSFARTTTAQRPGQQVLPFGLKTRPKKHQEFGITWLQQHWCQGSHGAMLCDDMGLGKTFQALAFCLWLREQMQAGHIPTKPLLLIAPVGLLRNWEAEIDVHLMTPGLGNCRIPDDCIDKNRYPLFMARSVLRELIESLPSTRSL